MKTITLLLNLLLLLLLLALGFYPQPEGSPAPTISPDTLPGRAILLAIPLALLSLLIVLTGWKKAAAAPAPAAPKAPPAARAEAEVVALLAALQEKGRLIDFLMDDVTPHGDAQVGAAARVVHQGCRAVLSEHFDVQPVESVPEGSSVTVPAQHAADEYRLSGNLSGEAPFTGTLVHKGWKTTSVKLPRLIEVADDADRLPAIAPAEVEIR